MTRDELCFFNFASEATNPPELLYDQLCADVVRAVVEGYNGTIILHGTSSSDELMMGSAKEPGLIVLGLADLFDSIRHAAGDFFVSVRFNEVVGDETRGRNIVVIVFNLLTDTFFRSHTLRARSGW
jgi:hypothetical protein